MKQGMCISIKEKEKVWFFWLKENIHLFNVHFKIFLHAELRMAEKKFLCRNLPGIPQCKPIRQDKKHYYKKKLYSLAPLFFWIEVQYPL